MLADFSPVHILNLFGTLPLACWASAMLSLLLLLQHGVWSKLKDFILCFLSPEYSSFWSSQICLFWIIWILPAKSSS